MAGEASANVGGTNWKQLTMMRCKGEAKGPLLVPSIPRGGNTIAGWKRLGDQIVSVATAKVLFR